MLTLMLLYLLWDFSLYILGSESRNSSQYLKPNRTIAIESVQCLGVESALTNCVYKSLSLDEGKQKLTDSDVAGVSCKKATSTSPSYVFSTPTPSLEANIDSKFYNTNNIIFGVLGSTTLIGIILIFV